MKKLLFIVMILTLSSCMVSQKAFDSKCEELQNQILQYKELMSDLLAINDIKRNFPKNLVGLSDHTLGIEVASASVLYGVSAIEKHFTFNKKLSGPDHKSSIEKGELKMLVDGVNANYLSRGSIKKIFNEEKEIVSWARESVVTIKNISPNEKLNYSNISTKRPSPKKGQIPANRFFKIIGKRVKKTILKDKIISFRDIK